MKFLIVGAGIAGLSLGFELLRRGAVVTVVEANHVASGASGAATAYMEPRLGTQPIRAVEWEGLDLWPDFAAAIEEASQQDVDFRSDGEIRVTHQNTLTKFENDVALREELGWEFERLSPDEITKLEPSLGNEIAAGLFLPQISWVNGRKVCASLARGIENFGGEIRTGFEVRKLASSTRGVSLTSTNDEDVHGDRVVLCTGVGQIEAGVPDDVPAARPLRGVNLLLDMNVMAHPIQHIIKHHRGNLCPRDGNRLIAGTTYDRKETSLIADQAVVETLYANAETILPTVRSLPLLDIWCGLRPKVGDGQISLGTSPLDPAVHYSLGHAGAGYLRAPSVAQNMAEWLLGRSDGGLLQPLLTA